MYKIVSKNVRDTIELGKKLSTKLTYSDLIILTGDLGTGKTYFTKGILRGFTNIDDVSSPTFTIVNEYSTNPPIFHFDVYRLNNPEEFVQIGGEEYLDKGICVIEWGENILQYLPNEYLHIFICKTDGETREIEFIPHGKKYEKYIKEIFNNENISN